MTDEQREAIDDRICEIMREHGPDRHIDGHDQLTDYAVELIAAETERCVKIADDWARDAHPKSKSTAEGIAADIMSGTAEGIAARIMSGK